MKKLIYILSFFIAILMLESCSKDAVVPSLENDPFAMEANDRGLIEQGGDEISDGGVIDKDNDDEDEDDDKDEANEGGGVIDKDNDDDDEDDDRDSDQGM